MEQIDDKGGTYQKHSFVCQQLRHSILERTVEAGAVYHSIICQMIIDMFIYALCIPYVGDGDHTDTVRGLYGNGLLHDL